MQKNVILDVTLKVNYRCIILYIIRHLPTNVWSQTVATGLKGNGNLQTTFVHMTKLCLSVTLVISLQNSKKDLKEHKKRHEEDLPYECKICHKRFQYRSGWKRHTDKDHK